MARWFVAARIDSNSDRKPGDHIYRLPVIEKAKR